MNILTFRKGDRAYRLDAHPVDIGGYSTHRRSWRLKISPYLQFQASLKILVHIGLIIDLWINIIEKNLGEFICMLSMTDSTIFIG